MNDDLRKGLDRLSSVHVLCLGDIMLDRFVRGDVERISPEAPVPVLKGTNETVMLGGTGNVIANLAALQVKTSFVGAVGDDDAGTQILRLLDAAGCKHFTIRRANFPTTTKTRFVARNSHIMRFDRESTEQVSDVEADQLLQKLCEQLSFCDVVLLSDYAKGALPPYFTKRVLACCAEAGKRVLVDPKGQDYSKYRGAFLVKPNKKELELVSGRKFDLQEPNVLDRLTDAARTLACSCDFAHIVVTLSEKGILHVPCEKTEQTDYLPTAAKEVFDVSGAGDTSFAVLGAALATGLNLPEAMCLANTASGIVVGKLGTATVSREELRDSLGARTRRASQVYETCILSREEAVQRVADWRARGLRVGFTNGCFDLLHLGHLSSLWQAKQSCDRLLVGLNSDASVRRLKGESRPVQNQQTRSAVLASLECVDGVVVFDEPTALPLVEALRPDVIAKEGYALAQWPEGRFVESIGGNAVTLDRVEGFSTSALVERMRKNGLAGSEQ